MMRKPLPSKAVKCFTIRFLSEAEIKLENMIDVINYNSSQIDMCPDELDILKASLIKLRRQFEHELNKRL